MKKRGRFERRLLAVMLILSTAPIVFMALFGAGYVAHSLERVGSPVLKQSARTSLELARALKHHLEASSAAATSHLGESYRLEGHLSHKSLEAMMKQVCKRHAMDFAALYVRSDSVWALALFHPEHCDRLDAVLPESTLTPESKATRYDFSDPDVVASAIAVSTDSILVTGFMLKPGTVEMMRRTGEDLSRYSSLPLYVRSQGLFLSVVITLIVVAMVTTSFLLSRIISRRISQPIEELASATERVAKGELDFKVDVDAKDEIASLVEAFNRMTADLKRYKEDLVKAERLAAWRDVARRVAHEIKNPLTPLQTTIYRLRERFRKSQNTEVIAMLDTMARKVEDLIAMANRFSEFAKMPEPNPKPIDLNELVLNVITLFESSVERISIKKHLEENLPQIHADPTQVRRLVENLVKNAIEAMPKGGTLSVRTFRLADRIGPFIRLEISDTGQGIPEEMKQKIFDPYFTTKPTGSGLGLALVHRIVKDHGGKIDFETSPSGTTFRIDLPVAKPAEEKA